MLCRHQARPFWGRGKIPGLGGFLFCAERCTRHLVWRSRHVQTEGVHTGVRSQRRGGRKDRTGQNRDADCDLRLDETTASPQFVPLTRPVSDRSHGNPESPRHTPPPPPPAAAAGVDTTRSPRPAQPSPGYFILASTLPTGCSVCPAKSRSLARGHPRRAISTRQQGSFDALGANRRAPPQISHPARLHTVRTALWFG